LEETQHHSDSLTVAGQLTLPRGGRSPVAGGSSIRGHWELSRLPGQTDWNDKLGANSRSNGKREVGTGERMGYSTTIRSGGEVIPYRRGTGLLGSAPIGGALKLSSSSTGWELKIGGGKKNAA